MILPNKYVKPNDSLLGISSILLTMINKPTTVTFLWDKAKEKEIVSTFNNFIFALDLLFILGVIELEDGLIKRGQYK